MSDNKLPNNVLAHQADLVRAAQAQIGSQYAGLIDASSIVQSVFGDLCGEEAPAAELPVLRLRVRHKVIDAVRKLNAARRGGRPPERLDRSDCSIDPAADGPTPSQTAAHNEILDLLEAELTPMESAVIRQHYLEGRGYREIAATLGLPLGSVGSHLASGLKKLRGRVGGMP